jgi:peptidoglycan/xylan/chitin deacetylase (PgdA/CDA1 family)
MVYVDEQLVTNGAAVAPRNGAAPSRPARVRASTRLQTSMLNLVSRLDVGASTRLPVVMYHRIAERTDPSSLDPALLSATPSEFEGQIGYLARSRRILSMAELLEVRRGEAPLPENALVITFDDAYVDFAELAWPILRRHGVPVTLFVPTAFPGTDRRFWWDRLHQALSTLELPESIDTPLGRMLVRDEADRRRLARALLLWVRRTRHEVAMAGIESVVAATGWTPAPSPVLDWPRLRKLAAEGVTLAPHSRTHPFLNQLPLDAAKAEILGSARDLEREIGASPPVFSLPAGGHSEELVEWLAGTEFEIVYTASRGNNDVRCMNWHRLRRIGVGARTDLTLLVLQFQSWFPQRSGFRAIDMFPLDPEPATAT